MKDIKAKILFNKNITANYYKMGLDASCIAETAVPGNFVMVRCANSTDPLLRRPFSVHSLIMKNSKPAGIELLYEAIGKGTSILIDKKEGEYIDVLGPLGNGFTYMRGARRITRDAFLIAGGIGAAPLVFLAEKLAEKNIRTVALIGAKTKDMILCEKDFRKAGAKIQVATDDGTYGHKGFVTNLLQDMLVTDNSQRLVVYSCGPAPMLKAVSDICREHKKDCQVSMEERMACGIGACMGCIVQTKKGNKLACKDGPVFKTEEIIWK